MQACVDSMMYNESIKAKPTDMPAAGAARCVRGDALSKGKDKLPTLRNKLFEEDKKCNWRKNTRF